MFVSFVDIFYSFYIVARFLTARLTVQCLSKQKSVYPTLEFKFEVGLWKKGVKYEYTVQFYEYIFMTSWIPTLKKQITNQTKLELNF